MPTTDTTGNPDPAAQAAQSQAAEQAASAVTGANTTLSGAQEDMATALAEAAAANQRAAHAITACCEQLTAMDVTPSTPTTATSAGARGTTTTTGGTWTATGDDPTSRDLLGYAALGLTTVGLLGYALGDHSESPADAARDSLGGFGEAAWDAGPGMIGTLLGLAGKFPGDTGDAEASREITEAHAWLQKWWGADTSSRAYKSEKSAGDVASLFIGGGEARYGLKATEVGVDAIRGTAGAEDATALVRATEANPAEVPAEVSAVGGAPIKAKPPWLQRVQEGDDFHREQQAALKAISPTAATEVHVVQPGRPNTYPYNRVDAYDPITGDIISMKNTQLAGADTEYAKSLIREAAKKYSPGTRIASTPSNATQGLPGGILTGQTVLLLPKQDAPIPEDLLRIRPQRASPYQGDGMNGDARTRYQDWNIAYGVSSGAPYSSDEAQERFLAGEQITVISGDAVAPDVVLQISQRGHFIFTTWLDRLRRPQAKYIWGRPAEDEGTAQRRLLLHQVVLNEYDHSDTPPHARPTRGEVTFFQANGDFRSEKADFKTGERWAMNGSKAHELQWEDVPQFGEWERFFDYERS